jgi:hypothetical protein
MLLASATGRLDFSKADSSWRWLAYERAVLSVVGDECDSKLLAAAHIEQVAARLSGAQTDGSILRMLGAVLQPYEKWDEQASYADTLKRKRDAWEAHFGRLDDPDTQRRLAEYTASLQQKDALALQKAQEDAILQAALEKRRQQWEQGKRRRR